MQTITALFIAIGILLVSKTAEADSLFVQAGVFLIGGGTLFMSTKSASLAAQFLGGGGLAGQAFGALQGIGKGLGGKVQNLGSWVSDKSSLESVEERRQQGAIDKATSDARDARLREADPNYRKPILQRLPVGIGNKFGAAMDKREQKLSKNVEAQQKAAEAAAVGPKFDVLHDEKFRDDGADASFADRFRGRAYRGQKKAYEQKVAPGVQVLTQTGLKPKEFSAAKTAIDMFASDPNAKVNWGQALQRESNGRVKKVDGKAQIAPGSTQLTGTFKDLLNDIHSNGGFAGLDTAEVAKARNISSKKEFESLSSEAQTRIMEEIRHRMPQNAPGNRATGNAKVMSIGEFFAEGRRRDRQYDELSVNVPASGGGGGGRSGGGTP